MTNEQLAELEQIVAGKDDWDSLHVSVYQVRLALASIREQQARLDAVREVAEAHLPLAPMMGEVLGAVEGKANG